MRSLPSGYRPRFLRPSSPRCRRRILAGVLPAATLAFTVWLLASVIADAENVVFAVGNSTGANRSFDATAPITYNFGVTPIGENAGLIAIQFDFTALRGQSATAPVVFTIYDGLGGTGTAQATQSIPASSFRTAFNSATSVLTTPLPLESGYYSLKVTTAATGSGADTYQWKDGVLKLTNTSSTPLTSYFYVEDSNTNGTAGTTLNAVSGVLAMPSLATTTVGFGSFRLGDTLSQTVALTNANLATGNNFSEALAGTATTTGTASVSGLPTTLAPLPQGQSTNLTIGLGSATAGPVSGAVNLTFTSEQGTSVGPGPYGQTVGTPSIAVSGTGYREAVAGFSTTSASLGKFHVGATNVTGTITLDNTATADAYSEGLAAAETSATGGASVVSGLPTVASPLAAGSQATITLGLASVTNVGTGNAGTVTLGLDTSGTGTSGLAAASIGSQVVNVSAQGYSGQSIWQADGSGSWSDFNDWDVPGGTPGVDGSLSESDTATFGNVATNPTTVSLDGVSPALASLTFSNAVASYTLAPGSGGSVTVGTAGSTGTISTAAGSHQITANLAIGRDTGVATATGTVLTLAGALSGSGVTLSKTGAGTLAITGTGGFSGGTTVTEGTLKVNGSIGSSAVTVQAGATLAGSGTVGGMSLQAGGTLSPGNSPGTTTSTSTVTWLPGADYNWQIYDATGTAGSDWDLLSITSGNLDLTNLDSANRFDLNLWSLSSLGPDVDGNALNFDNTQAGSWTIARVTGGGSILGFTSDLFNINVGAANGTSGFSNPLGGGSFSVQQSGSDLNLVFAPVPEPSTVAAAGLAAAVVWTLRRRLR
jgi:fibronectin-binding autotransporter adhesin